MTWHMVGECLAVGTAVALGAFVAAFAVAVALPAGAALFGWLSKHRAASSRRPTRRSRGDASVVGAASKAGSRPTPQVESWREEWHENN